MTAPFVRAWFAARLTDWCDHAYACWRGLLHALGVSTEWDPCEIDARYLLDLPGPASPTLLLDRAGELQMHTLMPCPVCHVSVGKDCITRFGNITGPHKRRREAAAAQGTAS